MKGTLEYVKRKRAAIGSPCAYCGKELESFDSFTEHNAGQDGAVWVHYRCHDEIHRRERLKNVRKIWFKQRLKED